MKNEIAAPLGLAMTCKDIYYARINFKQRLSVVRTINRLFSEKFRYKVILILKKLPILWENFDHDQA